MSAVGDSSPQLAVVDYGMGNRRSVQKALAHVGARATITREPGELHEADGLVVPGVGAFAQAMRNLRALGLDDLIRLRAEEGTPILGICLGMQLLFDGSEEIESTAGLGLIAGDVRRLNAGALRVPHIGWNDVRFERPCALTEGLPASGAPFYHVHSLAAHPADPSETVGSTEYGERFATIVQRENIFAVQFHPEKSSAHGLAMLARFVELCSATGAALRSAAARA